MRPSVFRLTSTALLVVLVLGTITSLAIVSFELVRRQNDVTQAQVLEVRDALRAAVNHRDRADDASRRTLRLEARRLRLSILVETCTVLRLQGQRLPRCHGVQGRAHALVEVIRDFRARLAARRTGGTDGGADGVTITKTTTITHPASPSPKPQCTPPPANPPPNC